MKIESDTAHTAMHDLEGSTPAPRDEETFRRFVEPHRGALHAHCYRMMGSVHDADDALQDALLRAWRGLERFEGRSTAYTWLHRIATNACLDALARRSRRVIPIDYGPSTDPADPGSVLDSWVWIEPYPSGEIGAGYGSPEARYELRESVELAFIAALQHLPPRQRAVLILKDVLGIPARDIAEALDSTTASVNSALQRARRTMGERLPAQSQQATMRAIGDAATRDIVTRFIDAFERRDIAAILELLTDDVTFAMPPYAGWCQGRDAVAESWLMPGGPPPRLRYVRTWANGQPAVGAYLLDNETGRYLPIALDVLAVQGARIGTVLAFRTPEVFARFGLPHELASLDPDGTSSGDGIPQATNSQ
jgi:RNA polymerase sigma-70 factor (ECF subfamily)